MTNCPKIRFKELRLTLSMVVAFAAFGVSITVLTVESSAKADTLQMSSDNGETGWYPNEPALTPSAVQSDFGQLFNIQLAGAIYAQPLVVQPTVLVATQADNVYGLNSTTGAINWMDNVGTPADPEVSNNCADIGTQMGITSTPVIDPLTDTAYFVAATDNGPGGDAQYYMDAVNVQTGVAPAGWPVGGVEIQGSADDDAGTVFDGNFETQRAGLIELGGVVYASFSSQCDHGNFTGWLVGVNASTASITTMWASETGLDRPNGGGGGAGIWQSGSAPVVDSQGDIFVATGNGSVPSAPEPGTATTVKNYGEAVIELRPSSNGQLQVINFFIADDASTLNGEDGDLGSGGPVALPASMGTPQEPNVMVEVGKEGILYALNMDSLGGYKHGPANSDAIPWEGGPYGGVWSRPTVWPGDGGYIYYPTAGTIPVKTNGGSLEVFQRMVSASGAVYFQQVGSTANSNNTFGFSSGAPIITSSGTSSGSALLWIIHATSSSGTGAELQAYNPLPQNPGTNGTLNEVWHSTTFTSAKFSPPGVDNGIIYVGTRTGNLLGFGLLATSSPAMSGDNVDFSSETISQSETMTATLTATRNITLSSFSASGPFSIGSSTPALQTILTTGQSVSMPVTFTPTTIGTNTGTLTASVSDSNGPSTATITLEGDGLAASQFMSATPEEVNFSPQPIDGDEITQPVTFTNDSLTPVTISGLTPPAPPFSITGAPAANTVVQPGGTISFTVTFTPPGSSGDFVHVFGGVATIDTSAGNFGVPVSGSAVPPAQINITPYELDFGNIAVGTARTMTFQIGDEGGAPLTITSSTPPSTNGFSSVTTLTTPDVIQGNTSIEETVQFLPTAQGPFTSSWLVEGDDGSGLHTVTFTGTGTPASGGSGGGGGGGGGGGDGTTTTTSTTTTTLAPTPPTITITSLSGMAGLPLQLTTSGDPDGGALTFKATNGTALGCAIKGGALISRTVGTCVVIALRAATSSVPSISSSETTISLSRKYDITASHPVTLTVNFSKGSSSLTGTARIELQILAADMQPGDALTVTGYAFRNFSLARKRVMISANFFSSLSNSPLKEAIVTTAASNKVVASAR
jgi:hypothetical protein